MSYGFDLIVSGKTGTRTVPIVQTAPLLETWLNHHPLRGDKQAFVFVRLKGSQLKALTVPSTKLILDAMVRRAGIRKPVTIHWFRHTMATWCSERDINEAKMRELFGWTKASNMPSRYTHLHKGAGAKTKLALMGVEKIEVKTERPLLEPKKCFRCGTMNSFDASNCQHCGLPLNREEAEKVLQEKGRVDELQREVARLRGEFQEYMHEREREREQKMELEEKT